MDHESAHELYRNLKAYDLGAKSKQGLGFNDNILEDPGRQAKRHSGSAAAAHSSMAQAPSDTRSNYWRHEAEGRDAGAAHRMPGTDRYRHSEPSPDRAHRSIRGASGHSRNDEPRRDNRWLMDDERQAHREGSRSSRQPSGSRADSQRHSSVSGRDREHLHAHRKSFMQRDGGRSRSRSRRRSRDRDRDRDRVAHGSDPSRRSHRSRSRSRTRPAPQSSRRADPAALERHSGHPRQRQPSPHRHQTARHLLQQKPVEPDWHKLIDGYDQMTQAMRLRARTRYQLQSVTTKALDGGQQWTRYQFDSDQPPNGDEAGKLDAEELPENGGRVDASHEAAIFGAPPKQIALDSEDDEDAPQVVELPEEVDNNTDMLPIIVDEACPSRPKLSWRERAAQLKAQREAQAG